jgi:hypothetical protein
VKVIKDSSKQDIPVRIDIPPRPGGPASAITAVCDPHHQLLKNQRLHLICGYSGSQCQKKGSFIYLCVIRKPQGSPDKIK